MTRRLIDFFAHFADHLQPLQVGQETLERIKKRAEGSDAKAINMLGCYYYGGKGGLPQDNEKATELFFRAGELGFAAAYRSVAVAYYNGEGVERDMEKAKHYEELAAMGGDVVSRNNLGIREKNAGSMNRAVKHWMISSRAGCDNSLTRVR